MVVEKQRRNSSMKTEDVEYDLHPVSFEGAISATGYGKFNILLLSAVMFPCLVQVLETVDLSYVVPIAQCDLGLRLEDKGLLNASTFIGMIISGFFWGYLCDSLGRKKIIIYGYMTTSIFALLAAFSTSATFLMITKFFSGFILNGPYSASISYITEFHSSAYRSRIQLVRGVILSGSNIILPFLAWAILPRNWNVTVGPINLHSWNIFLLVCAMVPFITGVVYMFFPESPKYLMSTGRNHEALKVFRRVYEINTSEDECHYPVRKLEQETSQANKRKSTVEALREGLLQMKPLFKSPYAGLMLVACFNGFSISTSSNTLKLWLPQIFQSITDYQHHHNSTSDLCSMLEELTPDTTNYSHACIVNRDNMSVYTNSITVSVVRVVVFILTVFINTCIKSKYITIAFAFANGITTAMLYFAKDSITVLILSSLVSGFGSVVDIVLVNITLELFPTTLRTVAVSLHLMSTRIGILVGSITFPYLLYAGCAPPFLFISVVGLCCALFSFVYPITDNRPLL